MRWHVNCCVWLMLISIFTNSDQISVSRNSIRKRNIRLDEVADFADVIEPEANQFEGQGKEHETLNPVRRAVRPSIFKRENAVFKSDLLKQADTEVSMQENFNKKRQDRINNIYAQITKNELNFEENLPRKRNIPKKYANLLDLKYHYSRGLSFKNHFNLDNVKNNNGVGRRNDLKVDSLDRNRRKRHSKIKKQTNKISKNVPTISPLSDKGISKLKIKRSHINILPVISENNPYMSKLADATNDAYLKMRNYAATLMVILTTEPSVDKQTKNQVREEGTSQDKDDVNKITKSLPAINFRNKLGEDKLQLGATRLKNKKSSKNTKPSQEDADDVEKKSLSGDINSIKHQLLKLPENDLDIDNGINPQTVDKYIKDMVKPDKFKKDVVSSFANININDRIARPLDLKSKSKKITINNKGIKKFRKNKQRGKPKEKIIQSSTNKPVTTHTTENSYAWENNLLKEANIRIRRTGEPMEDQVIDCNPNKQKLKESEKKSQLEKGQMVNMQHEHVYELGSKMLTTPPQPSSTCMLNTPAEAEESNCEDVEAEDEDCEDVDSTNNTCSGIVNRNRRQVDIIVERDVNHTEENLDSETECPQFFTVPLNKLHEGLNKAISDVNAPETKLADFSKLKLNNTEKVSEAITTEGSRTNQTSTEPLTSTSTLPSQSSAVSQPLSSTGKPQNLNGNNDNCEEEYVNDSNSTKAQEVKHLTDPIKIDTNVTSKQKKEKKSVIHNVLDLDESTDKLQRLNRDLFVVNELQDILDKIKQETKEKYIDSANSEDEIRRAKRSEFSKFTVRDLSALTNKNLRSVRSDSNNISIKTNNLVESTKTGYDGRLTRNFFPKLDDEPSKQTEGIDEDDEVITTRKVIRLRLPKKKPSTPLANTGNTHDKTTSSFALTTTYPHKPSVKVQTKSRYNHPTFIFPGDLLTVTSSSSSEQTFEENNNYPLQFDLLTEPYREELDTSRISTTTINKSTTSIYEALFKTPPQVTKPHANTTDDTVDERRPETKIVDVITTKRTIRLKLPKRTTTSSTIPDTKHKTEGRVTPVGSVSLDSQFKSTFLKSSTASSIKEKFLSTVGFSDNLPVLFDVLDEKAPKIISTMSTQLVPPIELNSSDTLFSSGYNSFSFHSSSSLNKETKVLSTVGFSDNIPVLFDLLTEPYTESTMEMIITTTIKSTTSIYEPLLATTLEIITNPVTIYEPLMPTTLEIFTNLGTIYQYQTENIALPLGINASNTLYTTGFNSFFLNNSPTIGFRDSIPVLFDLLTEPYKEDITETISTTPTQSTTSIYEPLLPTTLESIKQINTTDDTLDETSETITQTYLTNEDEETETTEIDPHYEDIDEDYTINDIDNFVLSDNISTLYSNLISEISTNEEYLFQNTSESYLTGNKTFENALVSNEETEATLQNVTQKVLTEETIILTTQEATHPGNIIETGSEKHGVEYTAESKAIEELSTSTTTGETDEFGEIVTITLYQFEKIHLNAIDPESDSESDSFLGRTQAPRNDISQMEFQQIDRSSTETTILAYSNEVLTSLNDIDNVPAKEVINSIDQLLQVFTTTKTYNFNDLIKVANLPNSTTGIFDATLLVTPSVLHPSQMNNLKYDFNETEEYGLPSTKVLAINSEEYKPESNTQRTSNEYENEYQINISNLFTSENSYNDYIENSSESLLLLETELLKNSDKTENKPSLSEVATDEKYFNDTSAISYIITNDNTSTTLIESEEEELIKITTTNVSDIKTTYSTNISELSLEVTSRMQNVSEVVVTPIEEDTYTNLFNKVDEYTNTDISQITSDEIISETQNETDENEISPNNELKASEQNVSTDISQGTYTLETAPQNKITNEEIYAGTNEASNKITPESSNEITSEASNEITSDTTHQNKTENEEISVENQIMTPEQYVSSTISQEAHVEENFSEAVLQNKSSNEEINTESELKTIEQYMSTAISQKIYSQGQVSATENQNKFSNEEISMDDEFKTSQQYINTDIFQEVHTEEISSESGQQNKTENEDIYVGNQRMGTAISQEGHVEENSSEIAHQSKSSDEEVSTEDKFKMSHIEEVTLATVYQNNGETYDQFKVPGQYTTTTISHEPYDGHFSKTEHQDEFSNEDTSAEIELKTLEQYMSTYTSQEEHNEKITSEGERQNKTNNEGLDVGNEFKAPEQYMSTDISQKSYSEETSFETTPQNKTDIKEIVTNELNTSEQYTSTIIYQETESEEYMSETAHQNKTSNEEIDAENEFKTSEQYISTDISSDNEINKAQQKNNSETITFETAHENEQEITLDKETGLYTSLDISQQTQTEELIFETTQRNETSKEGIDRGNVFTTPEQYISTDISKETHSEEMTFKTTLQHMVDTEEIGNESEHYTSTDISHETNSEEYISETTHQSKSSNEDISTEYEINTPLSTDTSQEGHGEKMISETARQNESSKDEIDVGNVFTTPKQYMSTDVSEKAYSEETTFKTTLQHMVNTEEIGVVNELEHYTSTDISHETDSEEHISETTHQSKSSNEEISAENEFNTSLSTDTSQEAHSEKMITETARQNETSKEKIDVDNVFTIPDQYMSTDMSEKAQSEELKFKTTLQHMVDTEEIGVGNESEQYTSTDISQEVHNEKNISETARQNTTSNEEIDLGNVFKTSEEYISTDISGEAHTVENTFETPPRHVAHTEEIGNELTTSEQYTSTVISQEIHAIDYISETAHKNKSSTEHISTENEFNTTLKYMTTHTSEEAHREKIITETARQNETSKEEIDLGNAFTKPEQNMSTDVSEKSHSEEMTFKTEPQKVFDTEEVGIGTESGHYTSTDAAQETDSEEYISETTHQSKSTNEDISTENEFNTPLSTDTSQEAHSEKMITETAHQNETSKEEIDVGFTKPEQNMSTDVSENSHSEEMTFKTTPQKVFDTEEVGIGTESGHYTSTDAAQETDSEEYISETTHQSKSTNEDISTENEFNTPLSADTSQEAHSEKMITETAHQNETSKEEIDVGFTKPEQNMSTDVPENSHSEEMTFKTTPQKLFDTEEVGIGTESGHYTSTDAAQETDSEEYISETTHQSKSTNEDISTENEFNTSLSTDTSQEAHSEKMITETAHQNETSKEEIDVGFTKPEQNMSTDISEKSHSEEMTFKTTPQKVFDTEEVGIGNESGHYTSTDAAQETDSEGYISETTHQSKSSNEDISTENEFNTTLSTDASQEAHSEKMITETAPQNETSKEEIDVGFTKPEQNISTDISEKSHSEEMTFKTTPQKMFDTEEIGIGNESGHDTSTDTSQETDSEEYISETTHQSKSSNEDISRENEFNTPLSTDTYQEAHSEKLITDKSGQNNTSKEGIVVDNVIKTPEQYMSTDISQEAHSEEMTFKTTPQNKSDTEEIGVSNESEYYTSTGISHETDGEVYISETAHESKSNSEDISVEDQFKQYLSTDISQKENSEEMTFETMLQNKTSTTEISMGNGLNTSEQYISTVISQETDGAEYISETAHQSKSSSEEATLENEFNTPLKYTSTAASQEVHSEEIISEIERQNKTGNVVGNAFQTTEHYMSAAILQEGTHGGEDISDTTHQNKTSKEGIDADNETPEQNVSTEIFQEAHSEEAISETAFQYKTTNKEITADNEFTVSEQYTSRDSQETITREITFETTHQNNSNNKVISSDNYSKIAEQETITFETARQNESGETEVSLDKKTEMYTSSYISQETQTEELIFVTARRNETGNEENSSDKTENYSNKNIADETHGEQITFESVNQNKTTDTVFTFGSAHGSNLEYHTSGTTEYLLDISTESSYNALEKIVSNVETKSELQNVTIAVNAEITFNPLKPSSSIASLEYSSAASEGFSENRNVNFNPLEQSSSTSLLEYSEQLADNRKFTIISVNDSLYENKNTNAENTDIMSVQGINASSFTNQFSLNTELNKVTPKIFDEIVPITTTNFNDTYKFTSLNLSNSEEAIVITSEPSTFNIKNTHAYSSNVSQTTQENIGSTEAAEISKIKTIDDIKNASTVEPFMSVGITPTVIYMANATGDNTTVTQVSSFTDDIVSNIKQNNIQSSSIPSQEILHSSQEITTSTLNINSTILQMGQSHQDISIEESSKVPITSTEEALDMHQSTIERDTKATLETNAYTTEKPELSSMTNAEILNTSTTYTSDAFDFLSQSIFSSTIVQSEILTESIATIVNEITSTPNTRVTALLEENELKEGTQLSNVSNNTGYYNSLEEITSKIIETETAMMQHMNHSVKTEKQESSQMPKYSQDVIPITDYALKEYEPLTQEFNYINEHTINQGTKSNIEDRTKKHSKPTTETLLVKEGNDEYGFPQFGTVKEKKISSENLITEYTIKSTGYQNHDEHIYGTLYKEQSTTNKPSSKDNYISKTEETTICEICNVTITKNSLVTSSKKNISEQAIKPTESHKEENLESKETFVTDHNTGSTKYHSSKKNTTHHTTNKLILEGHIEDELHHISKTEATTICEICNVTIAKNIQESKGKSITEHTTEVTEQTHKENVYQTTRNTGEYKEMATSTESISKEENDHISEHITVTTENTSHHIIHSSEGYTETKQNTKHIEEENKILLYTPEHEIHITNQLPKHVEEKNETLEQTPEHESQVEVETKSTTEHKRYTTEQTSKQIKEKNITLEDTTEYESRSSYKTSKDVQQGTKTSEYVTPKHVEKENDTEYINHSSETNAKHEEEENETLKLTTEHEYGTSYQSPKHNKGKNKTLEHTTEPITHTTLEQTTKQENITSEKTTNDIEAESETLNDNYISEQTKHISKENQAVEHTSEFTNLTFNQTTKYVEEKTNTLGDTTKPESHSSNETQKYAEMTHVISEYTSDYESRTPNKLSKHTEEDDRTPEYITTDQEHLSSEETSKDIELENKTLQHTSNQSPKYEGEQNKTLQTTGRQTHTTEHKSHSFDQTPKYIEENKSLEYTTRHESHSFEQTSNNVEEENKTPDNATEHVSNSFDQTVKHEKEGKTIDYITEHGSHTSEHTTKHVENENKALERTTKYGSHSSDQNTKHVEEKNRTLEYSTDYESHTSKRPNYIEGENKAPEHITVQTKNTLSELIEKEKNITNDESTFAFHNAEMTTDSESETSINQKQEYPDYIMQTKEFPKTSSLYYTEEKIESSKYENEENTPFNFEYTKEGMAESEKPLKGEHYGESIQNNSKEGIDQFNENLQVESTSYMQRTEGDELQSSVEDGRTREQTKAERILTQMSRQTEQAKFTSEENGTTKQTFNNLEKNVTVNIMHTQHYNEETKMLEHIKELPVTQQQFLEKTNLNENYSNISDKYMETETEKNKKPEHSEQVTNIPTEITLQSNEFIEAYTIQHITDHTGVELNESSFRPEHDNVYYQKLQTNYTEQGVIMLNSQVIEHQTNKLKEGEYQYKNQSEMHSTLYPNGKNGVVSPTKQLEQTQRKESVTKQFNEDHSKIESNHSTIYLFGTDTIAGEPGQINHTYTTTYPSYTEEMTMSSGAKLADHNIKGQIEKESSTQQENYIKADNKTLTLYPNHNISHKQNSIFTSEIIPIYKGFVQDDIHFSQHENSTLCETCNVTISSLNISVLPESTIKNIEYTTYNNVSEIQVSQIPNTQTELLAEATISTTENLEYTTYNNSVSEIQVSTISNTQSGLLGEAIISTIENLENTTYNSVNEIQVSQMPNTQTELLGEATISTTENLEYTTYNNSVSEIQVSTISNTQSGLLEDAMISTTENIEYTTYNSVSEIQVSQIPNTQTGLVGEATISITENTGTFYYTTYNNGVSEVQVSQIPYTQTGLLGEATISNTENIEYTTYNSVSEIQVSEMPNTLTGLLGQVTIPTTVTVLNSSIIPFTVFTSGQILDNKTHTFNPITINLPTFFPNSSDILENFENFYTTISHSISVFDDELLDTTLNTEEFRSMRLHDFDIITEFSSTTQSLNTTHENESVNISFVNTTEFMANTNGPTPQQEILDTTKSYFYLSTETSNIKTDYENIFSKHENVFGLLDYILINSTETVTAKNSNTSDIAETSSLLKLGNITQDNINNVTTAISLAINETVKWDNVTAVPKITAIMYNSTVSKLENIRLEDIYSTTQSISTISDSINVTDTINKTSQLNPKSDICYNVTSSTFVSVNQTTTEPVQTTPIYGNISLKNVTQTYSSVSPILNMEITPTEECNQTDFNLKKNCLCSIDSLVHDLRLKTKEKDFHKVLDNYMCPKFGLAKPGVIIGKKPAHRRRKRSLDWEVFARQTSDVSTSKTLFQKDVTLEDTDVQSTVVTTGKKPAHRRKKRSLDWEVFARQTSDVSTSKTLFQKNVTLEDVQSTVFTTGKKPAHRRRKRSLDWEVFARQTSDVSTSETLFQKDVTLEDTDVQNTVVIIGKKRSQDWKLFATETPGVSTSNTLFQRDVTLEDTHMQSTVVIIEKEPAHKRIKRSLDWEVFARETSGISSSDTLFQRDVTLEDTDYHLFVTPGSKVKIPCIGGTNNNNSDEMASTVWTFSDGAPLTEGKSQDKDGSLIIENIIPQDGGNYTCNNGGSKYPHQISVVSLAAYTLNANVLYEFPGKCTNEYVGLMYNSFPLKFENMLCGETHKICYVSINITCVKKDKSYVAVNISIVLEPLNVILPTLDPASCKITCEQKIYSKIVSILIKNVEAFETLPVFYSLDNKNFDLKPTSPVERSNTTIMDTHLPKLIIECFPGFGIIEHTHICSACGRNTYGTGTADKPICIKCPRKQYQPMVGSKSCLTCSTYLEDPACLPIPDMDVQKFKMLVGGAFAVAILLILLCSCCACSKRGKNGEHEKKPSRSQRRRQRDQDIEKQETIPLFDNKHRRGSRKYSEAPNPPPPDF